MTIVKLLNKLKRFCLTHYLNVSLESKEDRLKLCSGCPFYIGPSSPVCDLAKTVGIVVPAILTISNGKLQYHNISEVTLKHWTRLYTEQQLLKVKKMIVMSYINYPDFYEKI